MMATAAPRIRPPSKPPAKYSALPWPNGWSSSAGTRVIRIIHKANDAPARLTRDSSASESRLTEPVIHHASVFSAMVAIAATIDNQAKWWRSSCAVFTGHRVEFLKSQSVRENRHPLPSSLQVQWYCLPADSTTELAS